MVSKLDNILIFMIYASKFAIKAKVDAALC